MQQLERTNDMFPRRRSKTLATVALTCCAIFASWGYRHWFSARHTSTMPLDHAVAALREPVALTDAERDAAVRVVREQVLEGLAVLQTLTCRSAEVSLEHIRLAVR